MYKKVCLTILIGLVMVSTAYAGETIASAVVIDSNLSSITIPPSHKLYPLKLFIDDIEEILEERLSSDEQAKYELIQQHLDERTLELEYDARYNANRNTETLIERIQVKRLMAQTKLERLLERGVPCVKDIPCTEENREIMTAHWANQKRNNIEVLTNLLNKETMPESAKRGIENALSKYGMDNEVRAADEIKTNEERVRNATRNATNATGKQLAANMTMSYYSSSLSVVPFSRAMIYNPVDNKWYAAVITKDRATITDESTLANPQYYVYPTVEQINQFTILMKKINERGELSWYDKAQFFSLWFSMNKKESRG